MRRWLGWVGLASMATKVARRSVIGTMLVGLGASLPAIVSAQTWPERPVRIMVPAAPGGGLDVLVRALARELTNKWGQAVIVDNRGGASGLVGTTEVVSRGGRDGYSLLAVTENLAITNRFIYKNLPYDFDKDLAGVTLLAQADQLLIASTAFPANNMKELIELARKPGVNINYGAWGDGSQPQLVYETLKSLTGVPITGVNYKGVAPVLVALGANEVQLSVVSGGTAGPLIQSGRAKVLAAASRQRSVDFPAVPTTTEQGYPTLQSAIWFGLMTPSGTPDPVIDKISDDVQAIMSNPTFQEQQVTSKGWRVLAGGPREFNAAVRAQTPQIAEMINAAGVKPQ